jgi:hypothetical protein
MRSSRRVAVAFGALALTVTTTSCEDPVSVQPDIASVSTTPNPPIDGHFHRATIPGSDITNPPPGGRTYTSTTAMGHAHDIKVSEQQLVDLQQKGAVVSIACSPAGASSHSHTFTFEN